MRVEPIAKAEEDRIWLAAEKLYSIGLRHGWWGKMAKQSLGQLDVIGREEFLDITRAVIQAYKDGPSGS